MEEQTKTPLLKPALIYGLISGFIGILVSVIFYVMGLTLETWVGLVSLAIGIIVLVYLLITYRNEYLGGFASFGQIFIMGLIIGIISSIISAAYTYLLYTVIDPDLVEKMRIAAEEKIMNTSRIPESMYDDLFEKMEKRMQPSKLAIMGLILGPILNAIISLIIAAFVKKEENPVSNAV